MTDEYEKIKDMDKLESLPLAPPYVIIVGVDMARRLGEEDMDKLVEEVDKLYEGELK